MAGHFSSLVAADALGGDRLPVTVLTGFLGSGKTTLLNRLLGQADMAGTAVIVNEFGEIGIDHDLITDATEDTILLPNGCMCCSVRGDLIDAMNRLGARKELALRHVLIETSGLADPGPILRVLMSDAAVRSRFVLAGIACTVDSLLALGTWDRHPESVRQAAVADHLFLTKTDLLEAAAIPSELLDRLREINAEATLHVAPETQPRALLALVRLESVPDAEAQVPMYRRAPRDRESATDRPSAHRDGISSFVVMRDVPLPREAFFAWLDMVIGMRGEDLLRVKGLVQFDESPDTPTVIHGVQHMFSPPAVLPTWPGQDRRTRIVFITRGVQPESLDETLDVLIRRHMKRAGTPFSSPP